MCMSQLSSGIHHHQKHLLPHCTSHILFFDFHTLVPNVASPWQFSPHPLTTSISSSVGLNMGQFCPRGDIWQCLKMFSIVITGSKVLTSMKWTEASDAAKHLTEHTSVLQHKVLLSPKCQWCRDLTGPHFKSHLPWTLLCACTPYCMSQVRALYSPLLVLEMVFFLWDFHTVQNCLCVVPFPLINLKLFFHPCMTSTCNT